MSSVAGPPRRTHVRRVPKLRTHGWSNPSWHRGCVSIVQLGWDTTRTSRSPTRATGRSPWTPARSPRFACVGGGRSRPGCGGDRRGSTRARCSPARRIGPASGNGHRPVPGPRRCGEAAPDPAARSAARCSVAHARRRGAGEGRPGDPRALDNHAHPRHLHERLQRSRGRGRGGCGGTRSASRHFCTHTTYTPGTGNLARTRKSLVRRWGGWGSNPRPDGSVVRCSTEFSRGQWS